MTPSRPSRTTPGTASPERGPRSARRLFARALRLRCPNCGQARMFSSWLKVRHRCPNCGLLFDRGESDYFIGALLVNFVIAELLIVALMLVLVAVTWPAVPWDLVQWGIIVLLVPGVFLTYPFSRSLWLAVDLLFRPPEPKDFAPDAEEGPEGRPEGGPR